MADNNVSLANQRRCLRSTWFVDLLFVSWLFCGDLTLFDGEMSGINNDLMVCVGSQGLVISLLFRPRVEALLFCSQKFSF